MWDVATAKADLGITGNGSDAAIERTMAVAQSTVETWLQRGIVKAREIWKFRGAHGDRLVVFRFPVIEVHALTIGGQTIDPATVIVHHREGWIWHPAMAGNPTIEVDLTAGFDPMPAALEAALWDVFHARWAKADPTTGAVITPSTGQAIKAVSIPDAISIQYATAYDAGAMGAQAVETGLPAELAGVAGLLAPYRDERIA